MELTKTRPQENRDAIVNLNNTIASACDDFWKLTGLRVADIDFYYDMSTAGKEVYHKASVRLE